MMVSDSEVREHYEQSLSCIETGKNFGIHFATVCNKVRKAGGEMLRPKGRKRFIGDDGYVYIFIPVGDPLHYMATRSRCYAAEHRLVMVNHLGRSLLPGENVHHINGDKTDNHIENLELWRKPQPTGIVIRCNDCGSTNCTPSGGALKACSIGGSR